MAYKLTMSIISLLGLIINCHLDSKLHLNPIGFKIARVIGLLRKLKYMLASYTSVAIYL